MTAGAKDKAPAVALIVALGALFVFFSHRPLWHTDLWGHLAYGRWIWEHRRLPVTEPFMPLSRNVPIVDTAWLSQVAGYAAFRVGGVAALQVLYASLVTWATAALAWGCFRRTRHLLVAGLACVVFLAVDWRQLQVIRPQLGGLVCFVVLLVRVGDRRVRSRDWWLVPGLFAVWANLHGSFVMGIVLLGSVAAGRAGDLLWRRRTARSLPSDARLRRLMVLTGLTAAAVLVNPYGAAIYGEVLTLARNPNLQALTEWWPLSWRSFEGRMFAAVAILLGGVALMSCRRVRLEVLLPVLVLGAGTLWHSRLIVWWGPLAGWAFAVYASALARRWECLRRMPRDARRQGWGVIAGAVFATSLGALMLSPLGLRHLPAAWRPTHGALAPFTPVKTAEYLRESSPRGLIFNTYEWGDYFVWRDPDLPVLLTSHAHLVPPAVWDDYLRVINAAPGWSEVFDRYAVRLIVLDKARRRMQIAVLRESPEWRAVHEDRLAVVFARRGATVP